jgi:methyl-accepting chemotaxis protein
MSTEPSETARILDNALSAHQEWKSAIHVAVASGRKLDVASIRPDDCCELGRWLHGDGRKLHSARLSFTELLETHADFHVVASVVASILNHSLYDETIGMMEGRSKFAGASRAMGISIMRLKGELQKQHEHRDTNPDASAA